MKKRIILLAFVLVSVFAIAACEKKTYEIALITDVGTINDKSFNQGAWEGVEKYAKEHNISYKYYQPDTKATDDYIKSIDVAVQNGAQIIVTPGYLFENAVWVSQTAHPEVKFVILDGGPHNVTNWDDMSTLDGGAPNFEIKQNVYSILYAEEESGFLAGYAAVKEGFKKLGFMGGMSVPAVVRFGYGFIEGANYAATEMGLADDAIEITYEYLNSFEPKSEHQTKAASWYSSGIELIFAAAGGAGNSVMKAAEQATGKWVIGVDIDQKAESERVLTSAMKELGNSVYQTLTGIYDDNQVGGEQVVLDATVDGVGLPADFSRFTTFTTAMYDTIYNKVAQDQITIFKDVSKLPTDIVAPKVKLTFNNA